MWVDKGSAPYVLKQTDPELQMLVWNEIQEKSALSSLALKATKLPAEEIPGAPISTLKIYSIAFDVPANPSFVLNADVSGESLETSSNICCSPEFRFILLICSKMTHALLLSLQLIMARFVKV